MFSWLKDIARWSWFYYTYKKWKAQLAVQIYGNPSKDFFCIGVTGTNGKTTTTFMIHHIFNSLVDKSFLLGTNEIKYGSDSELNTSKMTSPDPMIIQSLLAKAKTVWCKIAIMEVASHGIDQHRYDGIDFDMAILTNITEEHLDYHKTMEAYSNCKKKLFTSVLSNTKPNKLAILPKDDKYGKKWIEELWFERMTTYSILGWGTIKADNIQYFAEHTSFDIVSMGQSYPITIPMVGIHNVYNTLAAVSAGLIVGLDLNAIIATFATFIPPLGRMQRIIHNNVQYYIDFAHTPDGLDKTLSFLSSLKQQQGSDLPAGQTGRLILLTGAMGQRDRYKRPEMWKIADRYADLIVIADEDPWEENRLQIIAEVREGIKRQLGDRLYIIPDRSLAIKFITEIVQPGDIVMLAGKGHETVMCIPWGKIAWDEKGILESYLK